MKYKKIICILFAALFIVTAASGAVARQETRSLKISDIFKSRMSRSEGMSIGEGPLARLLYSLLERFHSNEGSKIPDLEDPPEEEPEEEPEQEPEEEPEQEPEEEPEEKTVDLELDILGIDFAGQKILVTVILENKGDSVKVSSLESALSFEITRDDGVVSRFVDYGDGSEIVLDSGDLRYVSVDINSKDIDYFDSPGRYVVKAEYSYESEGLDEILSASSEFTIDDPSEPSEKVKEVSKSFNDYGLEMLQMLVDTALADGDPSPTVMFGPGVSAINLAMAMRGAGYDTDTLSQIQSTLNVNEIDQDDVYSAIKELSENHLNKLGSEYKLTIDNNIWANEELYNKGLFKKDYEKDTIDYWKIKNPDLPDEDSWRMMDLSTPQKISEAIEEIDLWIQEKTNYLIKDLIREGDIDEETASVLATASYMNCKWTVTFEEEDNKVAAFYDSPEKTNKFTDATYMRYGTPDGAIYDGLKYTETGDMQICQLPLRGSESDAFAITFLVPKSEATLSDVVGQMTADNIEQWQGSLESFEPSPVLLEMPKYRAGNPDRLDLIDPLKDMGMIDAFDKDRADFSRMHVEEIDGKKVGLYIKAIYHDAVMIVDENGVEAAAAQAAGPVTEIVLDHPFACYVSQPSTGIIMYAGTVGPQAILDYAESQE